MSELRGHLEYNRDTNLYPSSGKKYNSEPAVISLTSWKARINTVSKTLYSLLKQCPGFHIVLVLSEEEFPRREKELPKDLMLFIENEFIELLWVYKNYRSFKKVLFTMDKYRDVPIISADDDCIYTYNYAKELYDTWIRYDKQYIIAESKSFGSGLGTLFTFNAFYNFRKYLISDIINTSHDDLFYRFLMIVNGITWIPLHERKDVASKIHFMYNSGISTTINESNNIKIFNKIFNLNYSNKTISTRNMKNDKKIIVSCTSWKNRINHVGKLIYSMIKQTLQPDIIYCYLSTDEFPNKEKDLPEDLVLLSNTIDIFNIIWVKENTKAFKKVIPTIQKHLNDNCWILSIDDDCAYDKTYIEFMVNTAEKYPDKCLSCGKYKVHTHGACMIYNPNWFKNGLLFKLSKQDMDTLIASDNWIDACLESAGIKFIKIAEISNHFKDLHLPYRLGQYYANPQHDKFRKEFIINKCKSLGYNITLNY